MEFKNVYCPHCGKKIPQGVLNPKHIPDNVTCPNCGSQKNWKDGKRQTSKGRIQRYLCSNCSYRFS